jgi:hypothetical protein
MVSSVMRRIVKALAEAPYWQNNRDVLEHCHAAKQHLVHSIGGKHKGDLERCMLNQRPTLDITRSNRY